MGVRTLKLMFELSASHKGAEEMTNKGSRADLMYRLNVFPIIVPSLKERTDDLPELIDALLKITFSKKQQRSSEVQQRWYPGAIKL